MRAKWSEISKAFDFGGDEVDGFISKETGKVYMRSDYDPGIEELPEDLDDDELYLAVPKKRDLDLGGRLVDRFAEEVATDRAEDIRDVFAGKGAYRRLKSYLQRHGLLDKWYEFENAETEKALRAWCADEGIELEE